MVGYFNFFKFTQNCNSTRKETCKNDITVSPERTLKEYEFEVPKGISKNVRVDISCLFSDWNPILERIFEIQGRFGKRKNCPRVQGRQASVQSRRVEISDQT